MRTSPPVWWRFLVVVVGVALALPAVAFAQAPPPSFFDGRSNDDLRALALDPHNDVLLRRSAATRLVLNLADAGAFDAADAEAREFAKNIDPASVTHAKAVRRRRRVHLGAMAMLGVVLATALFSIHSARGTVVGSLGAVRRVAPAMAFFLLYSGLVGGCLASRYENGSAWPFMLLAAIMLPLLVVFRLWSAVGSSYLAARAGRGLAAFVSTLAIGFLVVELINPAFLEGFGL